MTRQLAKMAVLGFFIWPLNAISNPIIITEGQDFNEFTAGAIFLRPDGSNDYGVLVNPFNPNVATPILSPSWEPKGINPDFSTGFSLNFRRLFTNTDSDVSLCWARVRTSDNATFPVNRQPPPAQQMAGPFWNVGPDAGTTSAANGQLNSHYDVLNGEIGKYVNFEPNLQLRLFTGLSALWIQQDTKANFSGVDPILGLYTFGIRTESKYNALGMRLGFSGEYQSFFNINIVGLLAGNLYIGSQQPATDTVGTGSILTAGGIPENHQSISHRRFIQLVPGFDTKLGLKYYHEYSNNTSLALEAGYMASIYVNAMQNYVPETYVPGSLGLVSGSVYLQSLIKTMDSFSLDGPYLTIAINM